MRARLIFGLLVASLLAAAMWPGAGAQEATPDDAMQSEVTAAEEPAATDSAGPPAAPDVSTSQEELDLPTPTPAPTAVPVNADVLQAIDIPADLALGQGSAREFVYSYQVTTPRSSTTIVAELGGSSGQNGAWTVQLHAGDLWSEAGNRVVLTDSLNIGGGSMIALSVIVTAPPSVTVDETVTIWLSSSVLRLDGGVEQGLVATQPLASVSAFPPIPTPTPTPTLAPTETTVIDPVLTCAGPADYEVQIGREVHLTCEVTVLDSRAGAVVAIEPPSGWAVASGDGVASTASLEVGPFALDDDVATVHAVPITVYAPGAAGEVGALTLRLLQDSETRTELDSATIALTTFIPEDWQLTCSTGSTNAVPGGNVEIACELPEAAWALRGGNPEFAYVVSGLEVAESWALDSRAFSFVLDVPCESAGDSDVVSVEADLGNGVTFDSGVELSVQPNPNSIAPTLTYSPIDFGEITWTGYDYPPVSVMVTLAISAADNPCLQIPWRVVGLTAPFSSDDAGFDVPVEFNHESSTKSGISLSPDGFLESGIPKTIATGVGGGEMQLQLTLSLPPTIPVGDYLGSIEFSLVVDPG
jgi:hypothetical protein